MSTQSYVESFVRFADIAATWWVGWGKAALEDVGLENKDAFLTFVESDPDITQIYAWRWSLATDLFRAKDTPEFLEMKKKALEHASHVLLSKRLAQLLGGKGW